MSLFRRRLMALQPGNEPLYEYEVEYLQSDGNLFFTLPVAPSEITDAIEITFRYTTLTAQMRLCYPSANESIFQLYANSGSRAAFSLNTSWTAVSGNNYSALGTVKHTYKVDYKNKKAIYDFYEVTIGSSTKVATSNLCIVGKKGSDPQFKGNIYSVKFWRNDTLLYDLVPVKKNGKGYFFDKINEVLYGNEGTGDWTMGNIKLNNLAYFTQVDYIYTNSTTATAPYINTGISSNAGTILMTMVAKWNSVSTSYRLLCGNVLAPWFGCDGGVYKSNGGTTYPDIDPPSTSEYTTFTMNSYTPNNVAANVVGPLLIFRLYSNSNRANTETTYICRCKMKRFQITVNGVLVRDFVPVKHPAGTYGMFDLVENKFYESANSGSFAGGSD